MTENPTGRLLHHDPRNKNYRTRHAGAKLRTRSHRRYGKPFNQNTQGPPDARGKPTGLGSCTGNALAGLLNSAPLYHPHEMYHDPDAVQFYSEGTAIDPWPGTYPPEDTGCDGQSVAEAARKRGLITRYEHAFGIDEALATLVNVPVMTGVNWYEGMDDTDEDGFVNIIGRVRGGHEFDVSALAVEPEYVWCWNSWGPDWGVHGRFKLRWADWDRLLREDGDVTVIYR